MEIEITPAGKSTKRLSLLSGGEKSMTALAFLFAVFLARPCPFYILDEVEAALDDLNLDRFLALLRRYADRAQFIVITHQKRTMEAADWLYGVSMGGDGVSKVLSRRLPAQRRGLAERRPRSPRSPEADRAWPLYRRAARGARLERAVHNRRAARSRVASRSASRASDGAGGLFRRLRESMARPARRLARRSRRRCSATLDEQTWERLEEALIMADVGASTTASVVEHARGAKRAQATSRAGEQLCERLIALLAETARESASRGSTSAPSRR